MTVNKTLLAATMAMGLFAGSAYAHGVAPITIGDPFIITEGNISWTGGTGKSLNNTLIDTDVLAYHFSVTTPGSLDVYTSDHNDPFSYGLLYIYEKDAVGTDWTLVQHNFEGARIDLNTPTNLFGVQITGYINAGNSGQSDAGLRTNFAEGDYLALVVGSQGYPVGHDPIGNGGAGLATLNGSKLSAGFTWSWLGEPCLDSGLCSGIAGLSDFYIKASPGSLAVAGPSIEPAPVPVPGAVWLMGTALAGFGALGRKKALVA